MNFETMDWDAEARRVKSAFGLEGECRFIGDNQSYEKVTPDDFVPKNMLLLQNGEPAIKLSAQNDRVFKCGYYESLDRTNLGHNNLDRCYIVDTSSSRDNHTMVAINGLGAMLYVCVAHPVEARFLAKGLFHLGLLTPEIEKELGVSVTAHEQIEWRLEYETRNDL